MSVWLEQARAYPKGVVATPHYLATSAGLAMLAGGGNAVDAALAANLVLGVVTPYMCGVGGDLLATVWDGDVQSYRGVGRSPAGATLEAVREQSGSPTMPTFGPHPCTVPGAVDGWFTLLERWGTRSFGDVSAAARQYASDGFPLTRRGAWFFAAQRNGVRALRAVRLHERLRRAHGRIVGAPAGVGASARDARERRPRRVPPRTHRRGDLGAAATSRRLPHRCRRRRARGCVGRAAAGDRAGHRDPRAAAAHAGSGRARGLAHRPRSRSRARRPRPPASPDRGDEARARRPRRVRRRSGRDDRRLRIAAHGHLDQRTARAYRSRACPTLRAPPHSQRRHHLHEHRRP